MKTLGLSLVGALLLTLSLSAISYIAFEQITVANVSIGFTAATITPGGLPEATIASCRLETAEIRWRIDGQVPTTTVGTLLEIGDTIVITGHDSLVRFRSIRTGGSSGTLSCHYSAP